MPLEGKWEGTLSWFFFLGRGSVRRPPLLRQTWEGQASEQWPSPLLRAPAPYVFGEVMSLLLLTVFHSPDSTELKTFVGLDKTNLVQWQTPPVFTLMHLSGYAWRTLGGVWLTRTAGMKDHKLNGLTQLKCILSGEHSLSSEVCKSENKSVCKATLPLKALREDPCWPLSSVWWWQANFGVPSLIAASLQSLLPPTKGVLRVCASKFPCSATDTSHCIRVSLNSI